MERSLWLRLSLGRIAVCNLISRDEEVTTCSTDEQMSDISYRSVERERGECDPGRQIREDAAGNSKKRSIIVSSAVSLFAIRDSTCLSLLSLCLES